MIGQPPRTLLWALLALLAFLASSSASSAPATPDTLIYGAGLTPRGLNPLLDRNEWNEVSSLLLSRLFRVNHKGEIEGDLVADFTISPDGLTYRFRLRAGARWHDPALGGVTADDVLFTWQKLFDPNTQTKLDLNQPDVRSFEAPSPHEFLLHFRQPPRSTLLPLTEIPILPAHILRDADINSDAFDASPIGSGPYKLVRRTGNTEFVFERHDAYHFGRPPIPRLILRVIPDDDARAEALARGEVHLAQVKPQHVARLRPLPHLRVYRMRTVAWRGMPLNLRRPALQDVRVRRALDLAIDREAIVAQALLGFGQPAYSPIPPASWAFEPELNRPRPERSRGSRYDPAAAERLLEEAGWKKNPDGWRLKDTQVLELNLIVWRDELFRRTTAELIRQQLAPLGIRVNLHLVDNATYNRLAETMGTNFDSFIGGWGGLDPHDNLYKKFHSRGSQNYIGYSNPGVDALLERARAIGGTGVSPVTARRLYRHLVKLLTDDAVFLPLAYPDYVFAADARLSLGFSGESGSGARFTPSPDEVGIEGHPPVCDSWYEFPKFAHQWSWRSP